jgi:LysM repeat protein
MGMLIQGCKREQISEGPPPVDTNAVVMDTNTPPLEASNVAPPVVVPVQAPEVAGTEYVVVKGDSFAKIAKKFDVSVKAIQAANPGIEPTKLKVGQKLSIPASSGGASASAMTGGPASTGSGVAGETYTVKSSDTLTKIAKMHGTTIKAIRAENNLTTDHIKVGQKLKIPAKTEAAAPVAPPPPPDTAPAPAGTPGQ